MESNTELKPARRVINLQPVFDPRNVRNATMKRAEPEPENHGFDLLSIKWIRKIMLMRHTRKVFQGLLLLGALGIIYDGFFGTQFASLNFATQSAWIDYRGLLVLSTIGLAAVFCMACPFVLVSRAVQKKIGRNMTWPRRLQNKWLAIGLLLLILWSYEVFSLWDRPVLTASVTILYFAGAVLVDSFYKGNSFCKYVCPIGLFTQACSMASPVEIKSKSQDYCRDVCEGKECINGNEAKKIDGCQTFLYVGTKQSQMDCSVCLDCVRACPHDNIALQVRPPTHELHTNMRRRDFTVGAVAFVLAFTALSNAAGMISPFQEFERGVANTLGLKDAFVPFTVVFVLVAILAPLAFGWLTNWLTQKAADTDEPLDGIFKRYALGLLPLAFATWTAHYMFHFIVGAGGWWLSFQNMFVTAGLPILGRPTGSVSPLVPYAWIFPLQIVIIYLGFMLSGYSFYQISRKLYKKKVARRAMLPYIALALLIAVTAILIMSQPMQARGTLGG